MASSLPVSFLPTPLLCHFSPIFFSVFPFFYALRLTVVSNPFDSLTFLIQNFVLARMLHFPIDFTTPFVDAIEQANFLLQDVLLLDNPRWPRKFVGNTALLCSEEDTMLASEEATARTRKMNFLISRRREKLSRNESKFSFFALSRTIFVLNKFCMPSHFFVPMAVWWQWCCCRLYISPPVPSTRQSAKIRCQSRVWFSESLCNSYLNLCNLVCHALLASS